MKITMVLLKPLQSDLYPLTSFYFPITSFAIVANCMFDVPS
jgi:hypothetical protein